MKKIIIALTVLIILVPCRVYAYDVTVSDSAEVFEISPDEYIPEEISDKLSENGIDLESDNLMETLAGLILRSLKSLLSEMIPEMTTVIGIIMISSVASRIIDNTSYLKIINYISVLLISVKLMDVFMSLTDKVSDTLKAVGELLSLVLPSFCSLLLLGGGSFSAAAASASFGAVLALLNDVITRIMTPSVSVMFVMIIVERLAPVFSEIRVAATLKKYFMMLLSFITAMMLTVISFQSILGASKDSLSARTVKFAVSSFIPVVGGAVAESLKTVSAGIKFLKCTVGISVALALFCTVVPVICQIFAVKVYLTLGTFSGGLTGAVKEKELIEMFTNILDILNGIIICVLILSLLLIVLFVTTGFTVISS